MSAIFGIVRRGLARGEEGFSLTEILVGALISAISVGLVSFILESGIRRDLASAGSSDFLELSSQLRALFADQELCMKALTAVPIQAGPIAVPFPVQFRLGTLPIAQGTRVGSIEIDSVNLTWFFHVNAGSSRRLAEINLVAHAVGPGASPEPKTFRSYFEMSFSNGYISGCGGSVMNLQAMPSIPTLCNNLFGSAYGPGLNASTEYFGHHHYDANSSRPCNVMAAAVSDVTWWNPSGTLLGLKPNLKPTLNSKEDIKVGGSLSLIQPIGSTSHLMAMKSAVNFDLGTSSPRTTSACFEDSGAGGYNCNSNRRGNYYDCAWENSAQVTGQAGGNSNWATSNCTSGKIRTGQILETDARDSAGNTFNPVGYEVKRLPAGIKIRAQPTGQFKAGSLGAASYCCRANP